jgi:hypothetical protein
MPVSVALLSKLIEAVAAVISTLFGMRPEVGHQGIFSIELFIANNAGHDLMVPMSFTFQLLYFCEKVFCVSIFYTYSQIFFSFKCFFALLTILWLLSDQSSDLRGPWVGLIFLKLILNFVIFVHDFFCFVSISLLRSGSSKCSFLTLL